MDGGLKMVDLGNAKEGGDSLASHAVMVVVFGVEGVGGETKATSDIRILVTSPSAASVEDIVVVRITNV